MQNLLGAKPSLQALVDVEEGLRKLQKLDGVRAGWRKGWLVYKMIGVTVGECKIRLV